MTTAIETQSDTVPLDTMCWAVAPYFPKASDAAVVAALAQATRDLLSETHGVTASYQFSTQPCLNAYPIKLKGPLLSVSYVTVGDERASAASSVEVASALWRRTPFKHFYAFEHPDIVYLFGRFSVCPVDVGYAYNIPFNSCSVPRIAVDQWAEAIVARAKYYLASQAGAPWYNISAASIYAEDWRVKLRAARDMAAVSATPSAHRVLPSSTYVL